MPSQEEADRDGISPKQDVRSALIAWRDDLMVNNPPPFIQIVLLSHAIWWLNEEN